MALKKPASAPAAAANTSFEEEPGTTTTQTADAADAKESAAAAPAEQPKDQAAAAAVESTVAIARASASAVGAVDDTAARARQFKKDVEAMQGAADFSYGNHRVFKAKDGVIKEMNGEKVDLGKWVKVRLLAWDRHFEVSPGEEGKSSGDFVAYSKDGVTIDHVIGEEQKSWEGKSVAEYLEYLRETEDFDKASKREFIDCQVAALGSEEEPDFSGVVQVTLSSSSIPAFKKYQTDLEATAKCVAMGLPGYKLPEDPFTFYFVREAAEKGKNSWTKLKILMTLPAKV